MLLRGRVLEYPADTVYQGIGNRTVLVSYEMTATVTTCERDILCDANLERRVSQW